MKRKELLNLLANHADALNRAADPAALDSTGWLANYGLAGNVRSIISLLQIAKAVKQVLIPVRPSTLFRDELGQRLEVAEPTATSPLRRRVWVGAAAVGSILSLVGITLLLMRRLRLPSNRSRPMTTAV